MSGVLSIRGAGSDEVNGDYIATEIMMDGVATYFMSLIGENGDRQEYNICRSVSTKTKTKKWWICRTDRNGIDKDTDFYTCESESDTPPLGGWTALKGELPTPKLQMGGQEVLIVSGAGSAEVNGEYSRLSSVMDGVPKYSMIRADVDGFKEYTLCRSLSSKTKTKKWWLCRTDRNDLDNDIDFYTCEDSSDTPPIFGWFPLKGERPLPRLQYVTRAAPEPEVVLDTLAAVKGVVAKLNMSPSGIAALNSLLRAAESSPAAVPLLVNAHVMTPLLRMFAADITNDKILRLLFALVSQADVVPTLLKQGLLPALYQCCETWPEEVKKPQPNAINVLSKLSVCEKTERPMVDAGLHVCLLWAAENDDTRESAFNALLNIAFAKDCKQSLLDVGAIQVALKYGRDNTNSSAFKFLRSMSLHPPAFPKLAEVGIVALLKRNLAKNYQDEQNIWFVSNLSDIPEACIQLCETGCVPYLKMAMEDASPVDDKLRFRSWAITAVWRIAKVERCRPTLLNACVQDSLVAHTRQPFEPLLAMMGLALLVGRAEEGSNSQLIQASMGLTKRLMEAMDQALSDYVSGRSAFVKTKCSVTDYLNALACVATSDAHKAELTNREAVLLLVQCCHQCVKELDTVRVACDILLELTFSPAALQLLQAADVLAQLQQLKDKVSDPIGAQKVDSLLFRVLPQQQPSRRKTVSVPKPFIPAVEGALPPPYAAAASPLKIPEEKQGLTVYISYHFEHQKIACRLRDDLSSQGYFVWIDVVQGSGPDERAEGIEAANVILMDISSQYKESANCRLEAQYAAQLKKKIIPLVLEQDYSPAGWLGMVVANLRSHRCWLDSQYPEVLRALTLELAGSKPGMSAASVPPPYDRTGSSAQPALPPGYDASSSDFVAVPPPFAAVPAPGTPSEPPVVEWSCPMCTVLNHPSLDHCEVCESPRPAPEPTSLPRTVVLPSPVRYLPPVPTPVPTPSSTRPVPAPSPTQPLRTTPAQPPLSSPAPTPYAPPSSATSQPVVLPSTIRPLAPSSATTTTTTTTTSSSSTLSVSVPSTPPSQAQRALELAREREAAEHKQALEQAREEQKISLSKLQEQTDALIRGQVAGLSAQLSQALGALTSLQGSQQQHQQDLEALRNAIKKEPQALPALVQAAITTPEYEEMLQQTERRMQAALRSHASGLDIQLSVVATQLSAVSAKTDAMYAVYSQQKSVLMEQEALLKSTIAPFYNSSTAVLSSRLQAVLLVASGVLQAKRGAIVEKSGFAADGVEMMAKQAVSLAADVSVLAADAVPLVGAVVGALLRKGAERLDDYRSKKRQTRVAAQAVTTADAEALGELAARRCAQLFIRLVEEEKTRLDEDGLERAGRKAGQTMYDALVGGKFDLLLDEMEKKDSRLQDKELTAHALALAVQKKAMTTTGILHREGGIFLFKLTEADVAKMIRDSGSGVLSPAEKMRRAQEEEMRRAQASQLELLRKTVEVAVLSPRRAEPTEPPTPPKSAKPKESPRGDVAVDTWLRAKGFPELVPVLQGAFDNVRNLILGFQGLRALDIRAELGLTGIPGLAVATRLREALDKESEDA